jgi:hypothetical protein
MIGRLSVAMLWPASVVSLARETKARRQPSEPGPDAALSKVIERIQLRITFYFRKF